MAYTLTYIHKYTYACTQTAINTQHTYYYEKLTTELQISATLALITLVTFNAAKITANAITATQFLLFFNDAMIANDVLS